MSSRIKVIVAVATLTVGALLLMRGLSYFRVPASTIKPQIQSLASPPTHVADEPSTPTPANVESEDAQPLGVAASHTSMLASALPFRDGEIKASLVNSIDSTLNAFLSPEVFEYLDLLESQGVNPVRPENVRLLNMRWAKTSGVVKNAMFDLGGIIVRDALTNGKYDAPPKPGFSRMTIRDDNRRPFLATQGVSQPLQVECILPGEFVTPDGKDFDGTWILEFTYNPDADTWALTEMRLSGTPLGSPVSPLPI